MQGLQSLKTKIQKLKGKTKSNSNYNEGELSMQSIYEGLKYSTLINNKAHPVFDTDSNQFHNRYEKQRYKKIKKEFVEIRKLLEIYPKNQDIIIKQVL